MFSAKAHQSFRAGGSAPGFVKSQSASAESAIHSRGQFDHRVILMSVVLGFENQSRYDSRFQRFFLCELNSWGDAPGYDDIATSALIRNGKRKTSEQSDYS